MSSNKIQCPGCKFESTEKDFHVRGNLGEKMKKNFKAQNIQLFPFKNKWGCLGTFFGPVWAGLGATVDQHYEDGKFKGAAECPQCGELFEGAFTISLLPDGDSDEPASPQTNSSSNPSPPTTSHTDGGNSQTDQYCGQCGAELRDGVDFCTSCGEEIPS